MHRGAWEEAKDCQFGGVDTLMFVAQGGGGRHFGHCREGERGGVNSKKTSKFFAGAFGAKNRGGRNRALYGTWLALCGSRLSWVSQADWLSLCVSDRLLGWFTMALTAVSWVSLADCLWVSLF